MVERVPKSPGTPGARGRNIRLSRQVGGCLCDGNGENTRAAASQRRAGWDCSVWCWQLFGVTTRAWLQQRSELLGPSHSNNSSPRTGYRSLTFCLSRPGIDRTSSCNEQMTLVAPTI